MELFACIESRYSVRKFTEEPVSQADLTQIVDSARHAPSWKNSQTAHYIAVSDPQLKANIAEKSCTTYANNAKIINGAPTLIVVTTQKGICGYNADGTPTTSKGDGWEMFDAGIATQTFCLAAHAIGLGAVVLGIFDEDMVCKLLNLPENVGVAALIPLGHPATQPRLTPRLEVADILTLR